MTTEPRDILRLNGEPVLAKLEHVWTDAVVKDGVESQAPRSGYGLAVPMPEEMRVAAKQMAEQYLEGLHEQYKQMGVEMPTQLREQYEKQIENMPGFCLVDQPFTMVWN